MVRNLQLDPLGGGVRLMVWGEGGRVLWGCCRVCCSGVVMLVV